MAINIDTTFVISVRHKQKMYLVLEKNKQNKLDFYRRGVIEYNDSVGLLELRNTLRAYVEEHITPLLSAQVGIRIHEFLESARATVYIEVLFKDHFKMKNAQLYTPAKAYKMPVSVDVSMFLYQFFKEKGKVVIPS